MADKQGVALEHRKVWYDTFGNIPQGYHIHHKDGNRLNNSLNNLEMLSAEAHVHTHRPTGSTVANQHGEFTVKEESKRQSRHPKNKLILKVCLGCDKEFNGKRIDARHCSSNCRVSSWKHLNRRKVTT